MNPIVLLIGGLALSQMMKKKPEVKPPSEQPGAPTTSKPNIPGTPSLTIDDIHDRPGQLIDNVKWTFRANGQEIDGKHQTRKEDPIKQTLGNFMVITQTDPTVRPGEKKPDTVMLIVKDSNNRTIIAKRVIVGTKQIIDIQ
jgi:hypothetical protein